MDQRVLVTAEPSGIGRKIARAFAVTDNEMQKAT
jgi:NAD(P)-dependent dehydrogenase (short-subunit alcohol dehydrogenase family)